MTSRVQRSEGDVVIEFGQGDLDGLVFTGGPNGTRAREIFRLDAADERGGRVVVKIPDEVISVTSSFFRGLFGKSIVRAGSREKFLERFTFECSPRVLQNTVEPGISHALFVRKPLIP